MVSIAAIKIAQKQAGLSDPEYRRLLIDLTGQASCRHLTAEESRRVLHALQRMIARDTETRKPFECKLWALWYDLRQYLPADERTPERFVGIVCRASGARLNGVAELGTLTNFQAYKAIEALKNRRDAEAAKATPVPF